jgi:hypothetical protein
MLGARSPSCSTRTAPSSARGVSNDTTAMTTVKKIVLWTAGILVAFLAVGLSLVFWWVSSLHQTEATDSARAGAAFAEIRTRFAGMPPVFEIRGDRLAVARDPAASAIPAGEAVHILIWEPEKRTLSRVRLPFVIATVATEPVPLDALTRIAGEGPTAVMHAKHRGNELNVRIADLQRYGRTILLDGVTVNGAHVLMWND